MREIPLSKKGNKMKKLVNKIKNIVGTKVETDTTDLTMEFLIDNADALKEYNTNLLDKMYQN